LKSSVEYPGGGFRLTWGSKASIGSKTQTQDYVVPNLIHDFSVWTSFTLSDKTSCWAPHCELHGYMSHCPLVRFSTQQLQVAKHWKSLNYAYCFVWVRNLVTCSGKNVTWGSLRKGAEENILTYEGPSLWHKVRAR
jgi:hypothetical protein